MSVEQTAPYIGGAALVEPGASYSLVANNTRYLANRVGTRLPQLKAHVTPGVHGLFFSPFYRESRQ